jgi:competence ComEA-like helix-hairpin-helix protein
MTVSRWPVILMVALVLTIGFPAIAAQPANEAFFRTWERTERPVMDRATTRTWMWGPVATTGAITEPYLEAPGGYREVQYFDKTRMEINDPLADPDDLWFVTNGLLATELITGRIQVGHLSHIHVEPSRSQIAGDRHPASPTYLDLSSFLDADATPVGEPLIQRLTVEDGTPDLQEDPELASYGAESAYFVPETSHSVAGPFWEFMTSSDIIREAGVNVHDRLFADPFFATGFPITDAYWVHVPVGGEWADVLLQCFERRCLTWTPANPDGWQVEAGNIGRHYHEFRYGRPPEVLECVELNLATAFDLVQLPAIGPARAQAIMDHRPFESIEDLQRVPGIGPATVETILDQGIACIVYEFNGGNAFHQSK